MGNRIPKTRADRVKMHKAITTVLTAMPSDIKENMDQFCCYIQQWAQGLYGHKTLIESSQMSLRENFQDYMMHRMHNNPISELNQVGQRVIEFVEESVLQYQE